jgi:hypothetical protein
VLASVLAVSAAAQDVWVERFPSSSPTAITGHAAAYDALRDRTVEFGGFSFSTPPSAQTWEWSGHEWRRLMPATVPPGRFSHAMVFDSGRGRILMFGGVSPSDLWEWDGSEWHALQPAHLPSARWDTAMAYDAARGRVVLFSGYQQSADTWEWDGSDWTQRFPARSPSARHQHAMAYDAARGRVLLFGGTDGNQTLSETWEWDGSTWTERFPFPFPSARSDHAMVWDSSRQQIVMFGGLPAPSHPKLGDTWSWDGTFWRRLATGGPPPRDKHAMVFDAARRSVVVIGGEETLGSRDPDTWEFGPDPPGTYRTFGQGCARGTSQATLAPAPDRRPVTGQIFDVLVTDLVAGQPVAMFIGFSDRTWSVWPLPLELGLLGFPGCEVLVSLDVAYALANPNGSVRWGVQIPADRANAGLEFFNQALVFSLPPVSFSNAGAGRIGVR